NPLAREHGGNREKPLAAGPFVLEIIHEFEGAFPYLDYSNVGRRSHFQRAAVMEDRKCRGSIGGGAGDYLVERHAQHQELRYHVLKVDYLDGEAFLGPVRRESVREEARLQDAIGHIPPQMAGASIA